MLLKQKAYRCPLFCLLCIMALGYLCFHSLAGGTLLAANGADSYALQTQSWLAGRGWIENGENYPWLELAVFQGRYYVSFPPMPSVLLVPWVAIYGTALPSNLIAALYGLASAAGVYTLFARRGASPGRCIFLAALCCMGSNLWWLSTNGGVWFQAQVLNFCFVTWGLAFAAGKDKGEHTAAAFLLALAVGCRPFSILILALYFLYLLKSEGIVARPEARLTGKKESNLPRHRAGKWHVSLPGAGFWLPFAAAAAVGIALGSYNAVRFGNPLEFGHTYLPEFQRLAHGQFWTGYFFPNLLNLLRPVTLNTGLDFSFPLFNGFLPFVANPIFLWWAVRLLQKLRGRRFGRKETVLVLCWAAGLAALCLHETMGGWQFGARYTVDLIPYVLLDAATDKTESAGPISEWEWLLCAAAVLFNLYGAAYMISH